MFLCILNIFYFCVVDLKMYFRFGGTSWWNKKCRFSDTVLLQLYGFSFTLLFWSRLNRYLNNRLIYKSKQSQISLNLVLLGLFSIDPIVRCRACAGLMSWAGYKIGSVVTRCFLCAESLPFAKSGSCCWKQTDPFC